MRILLTHFDSLPTHIYYWTSPPKSVPRCPWHIPILEIGHADADETRRQHERMRQRASLGHMEVSFRHEGAAEAHRERVAQSIERPPNERSASAVATLRRRVQRESQFRQRRSPSHRQRRSRARIQVGDRVRSVVFYYRYILNEFC